MFNKLFNKDNKGNNPFGENTMDEEQTLEDIKEETKEEEVQAQEEQIPEEEVKEEEQKQEESEVEVLKREKEELNNKYIRLAADFDNFRKRQAQERESLLRYGTEECLKKVIEVVDNFDRAMQSVDKIDNVEKMKENFVILNKQLMDSLTKIGLEVIETKEQTFNPNLHEAVMRTPTEEYPEETIIAELQKGYKYGDKVLRPALVNVAVSE